MKKLFLMSLIIVTCYGWKIPIVIPVPKQNIEAFNKGVQAYEAKDMPNAIIHFTKSCDEDKIAGACSNLTLIYANELGTPIDYKNLVNFGEKSCSLAKDEEQRSKYCGNLAVYYGKKDLPIYNPLKSAELHSLACENGRALSCTQLYFDENNKMKLLLEKDSNAYQKESSKEILNKMSKYSIQGCVKGYGPSCYLAADFYNKDTFISKKALSRVSFYATKGCNEYKDKASCSLLSLLN